MSGEDNDHEEESPLIYSPGKSSRQSLGKQQICVAIRKADQIENALEYTEGNKEMK